MALIVRGAVHMIWMLARKEHRDGFGATREPLQQSLEVASWL